MERGGVVRGEMDVSIERREENWKFVSSMLVLPYHLQEITCSILFE
jgi:hypothetical protein